MADPVRTIENNGAQGRGEASAGKSLTTLYLTRLNDKLVEGLETSLWVRNIAQSEIQTGRLICRELWPFIRTLPDNIAAVRGKLPDQPGNKDLDAARKLLSQLADDERHYQKLFLYQCRLAGLSEEEVQASELPANFSTGVANLIGSMNRYCKHGTAEQGAWAIATAELGATQFARIVLVAFENYFADKSSVYGEPNIEEGLSWLRLHAKTNMRHALWMKRMLEALELPDNPNFLPVPVEEILANLFQVWKSQ